MTKRKSLEAVILAGGFGTRLAHVVSGVCKPMAPVAGRPFLRFIMNQLSDNGFESVVIADGYRREQIEGYFGNCYRGMNITYSSEDRPLLTGGAAKQALSKCCGDWVFILNGDTWLDVDFSAMEEVATSAASDVFAIVAVKKMHSFDRYGTVLVDDSGVITAFQEKRFVENGLINAGVYLLKRRALREMPDRFSLETDFFEKMVCDGHLKAVECPGQFVDIGVPDDYKLAQTMLQPLVKHWKLAVFDRDGTINCDIGHLHEPEKAVIIEKTAEIIRSYACKPDYKIVVASNQAGIAKGLYGEEQMRATNRAICQMIEDRGGRIDAWYFCPHHPDYTGSCECRKPAPGMLLAAMRDFEAEPKDCVMYGDSSKDAEAAEAAGMRFNYVFEGGASGK